MNARPRAWPFSAGSKAEARPLPPRAAGEQVCLAKRAGAFALWTPAASRGR
jgi:hypothetical protein